MTINLQVVGIFFKADIGVEIDGSGKASVKDVLDAAHRQARSGHIKDITKFAYRHDNHLVLAFETHHASSFPGRVTGNTYQPGEYYLGQDTGAKPSYTVWQYYILNPDKTPVTTGFLPFNSGQKIVPDGGFLIWRLVSVLAGPNPAPKVLKSALA